MHVSRHYSEYIEEARQLEQEGKLEGAARLYEQAIRQKPLEEFPYDRLMIIYRKFKTPEKELKVIDKALERFMEMHDKKLEKYSGKNKVGQLSKALLRSMTGDKKLHTDYPKPIPRWKKRKEAVEKKLGKS